MEATHGLVTLVRWERSPVVLYHKENFMLKSNNSYNVKKNGENRSYKKGIRPRRVWPRPGLSARLVKKSGTTVPKDGSHLYWQDSVPAHRPVILGAQGEVEETQ